MPNSVYKKIDLVGTSPDSISDAINNAIATASQTIDNVTWFEVAEVRGHAENGKVTQYQIRVSRRKKAAHARTGRLIQLRRPIAAAHCHRPPSANCIVDGSVLEVIL